MQQLDHQTGEALKGSGDTDRGRDLNEDTLGSMDVNLELASFVDGRVQQGEETLVGDVRSGITDVPVHLPHDTDMLIAVKEGILVLAVSPIPTGTAV